MKMVFVGRTNDTVKDSARSEDHEKTCNNNPETRSCETCDHHCTDMAGTGKIWNTCDAGVLTSHRWIEHATGCPKWKSDEAE